MVLIQRFVGDPGIVGSKAILTEQLRLKEINPHSDFGRTL
jgi:hypothetical protein